jgi:hypothetical protein
MKFFICMDAFIFMYCYKGVMFGLFDTSSTFKNFDYGAHQLELIFFLEQLQEPEINHCAHSG